MYFKNTSFAYGEEKVIDNITLEIKDQIVTSILGPSGCGKTTLLKLISGALKPCSGAIETDKNMQLSSIFQEPRLLPWLTVLQNVTYVLNSKKNVVQEKALYYLEQMDLKNYLDFYPGELSGGMAQRVSIARAMAYDSNTILMDEPFKGLDIELKLQLINLFNKTWTRENRTGIFVTHDILESILVSDEIIVVKKNMSKDIKRIINPIKREDRTIENQQIFPLEKELYGILLNFS